MTTKRVVTKRFIRKSHFNGIPREKDFELIEEELPPLRCKDVLFQALYLSVDPYMRLMSDQFSLGSTMYGSQVARVIESNRPDFKVGDLVYGTFGWSTHSVVDPDSMGGIFKRPNVLPDLCGFSPSLVLGVLGMPGITAWFGFTELCEPKPGDVLVVSGAAGAVGSLVGQLGKNHGLKVIGFAGSDDKVKMLTDELGFDHAFNYKNVNVTQVLNETYPDGIDCYFDNVGGELSNKIMKAMKNFGRVAVCGSISSYNSANNNTKLASIVQQIILSKQLTLKGFMVTQWENRWPEGTHKIFELLKEGKLIIKETIVDGFENTVDAFIGLFNGSNLGKMIVKI